MASQWPPKKNTAFTLFFSLYKSDGTIIANPGTYTKKVSIDGAAVADITAGVTEEDVTYGQLSVVLSAGEMNGDAIWVYIKDDTTGCVPFTCTLYTASSLHDEMKADTASILADTGTDGVIVASGGITAASLAADVQARLGIVAYGTAQAVTGTTIQLASSAAFADDELIGAVVVITGGSTGVGQSRMVTDYVSSTDTATVDTWTTTPTGTITYVVFAAAPASATSLPAVNVTQISGDATAADNLESACDGTGYPLGGGSIVAASVTGNVGGNVTGSVGSVVGDVGGNVNGSVAAVVSIGTGAITAASIATGAIDADALAADAVTEIWAGSTAPAASAIADAVWDEALSGHSGAGSAGLALSTASSGGVDPSVLADAIWDEALSGHATAGTAGKALSDVLVDTAEIGTAGAGLTALGDARIANLDATVSSRLAPAGTLATVTNLTNAPTSGDLTATMKASVTSAATAATPTAAAVTGAVGSVTAGVTLAADAISASALSAAAVDEILDEQIGDGTITLRQAIRGILAAAAAGKLSGAATTSVTIRNVADTQNVIVATVDADGNRTAVTFTP